MNTKQLIYLAVFKPLEAKNGDLVVEEFPITFEGYTYKYGRIAYVKGRDPRPVILVHHNYCGLKQFDVDQACFMARCGQNRERMADSKFVHIFCAKCLWLKVCFLQFRGLFVGVMCGYVRFDDFFHKNCVKKEVPFKAWL